MNIYYIDAGDIRFYSKKIDAEKAAHEAADTTGEPVTISKMFIAVDRENIARMANKMLGFTRFVGRVAVIQPRKRPRLKLRKIAAGAALSLMLLLPNPSDAATCKTRKSGSVTITTCSDRDTPFTQCRSYKSGSEIKTDCRK